MIRTFIGGALLAMVTTVPVWAAEDPIATRKALMQNVGAAAGAGGAMLKGQVPFNAVTAELVLRTMNAASLGFGELFPKGSETGGKSTAAPSIWEDRDGFNKAMAKFQADTAAGVVSKPADLDAFKVAFGGAASNCGACHKAFRIKK